jgi:16S rRNA (cytosine967-C5)-methyltransferase
MREAGRVDAAIEVLGEVVDRHRPAALALADWGKSHRFAGSGDRAAIGNLVFDALRRRASAAWLLGDDKPRALVLGTLRLGWGRSPEAIAQLCDGGPHAPALLSTEETSRLGGSLDDAPTWVKADVPEWLAPSLERVFGERLVEEGRALADRAPIDLRANMLKTTREKLGRALQRFGAIPTPYSPVGLRIPPPAAGGRSPNVEAEAAHARGHFEVQDEGSQLAALLAGARPRLQVADICAGAGGKTLALAAQMGNSGQIHAYDGDRQRLRPIFERLQRAGVRNAQVLEAGNEAALAGLAGRMDVVLVDAPCTGSGVWRRRPDAKWRVKPAQLAERIAEQSQVLALAAPLVKPGGRLAYVTCSLLAEENGEQVARFIEGHPEFALMPWAESWRAAFETAPPASADGRDDALLLTPARHGTDGFYVAVLVRRT